MMDRATGLAGLGVLLLAIYPLSAKGLEPILPSRVCQALVDQKPISECFAAIKQVPVDTDLQEIIKEISIMQQCDSPYIVKYYGSYFKNTDLWVSLTY